MSKKTDKAPEPMDASAPENKNPVPVANQPRACWALATLVTEVTDLYPDIPVEYSNPDGRNTMLDASFDLTALAEESDRVMLGDLIMLVQDDPRVSVVILEHDTYYSAALVSMNSSPRTQDKRDPFGLGLALDILAEEGSA